MTSSPSSPTSRPTAARWRRRALFAGYALLLLAGLALWGMTYIASERFVRNRFIPLLENSLGRKVDCQQVDPHWFRGFSIIGLKVESAIPGAKPLLTINRLDASFARTLLLRGQLLIKNIRIVEPSVSMFRDYDGRLSIGDLLDHADSEAGRAKKGAAAEAAREKDRPPSSSEPANEAEKAPERPRKKRILFDEIQIENGHVEFVDAIQPGAAPVLYAIENLEFEVRNLSAGESADTTAFFRARYKGMDLDVNQQIALFDLTFDVRHKGLLFPQYKRYRIESLQLDVRQRGRVVGQGTLDRPFGLAWDEMAPTAQINAAEFALELNQVDLLQFNPTLFPHGDNRISSGTLSADLSASVAGGGRSIDLAGTIEARGLSINEMEPVDIWSVVSASGVDLAVRRPERFDLDMRALREDRSRGRLQVRGGFDPATGESQGSVSASEFDLSALGPNVAEFAAGAAVLGGTISLDQSWSSRPDGNAISTHGTLECRDLVLQGGTEDDRSAPYSFSLQTDIRAENGRIWGGGPKNRAARMERFDGERSLDDWEIALDLNWRDEAASNSIALIGRSLDADSLLAVRETIRRNQSAARQRRIEAEKSFKERLARIQPEILTSSTLVQEAPPAPPPRIPVEEEEASETPDERPDWPPIRLEARLDKGSIGGRALENIRAQAWIRYPSIELESLSAAFEEASLRLEGACDLSSRPRFFRWRLAGEGVQAETVLGAVPNWRTDWLAGALDFVFEGQCRGASASQMSSSMEAALSVRARQGAVGKIDPLKSLGSFLGMDSFASFQYETLEAEASFARGKTTLQRLDARNSRQSLSLSGTIGMDGAIDWDADVGLKGDLYDSVKNLVIGESMTKDSAGYWHFPAHIRITGTLESAAAFFGAPALETAPAPQAESAN